MWKKAKLLCVLRRACATAEVMAGTTVLWGAVIEAQEPTHLSWFDRATITRPRQPDWVTPLITASTNLEEALIYDVSRKLEPTGQALVTAGGLRGIQFVPYGKLQLTFGAMPYLIHNDPKLHDGFGDTSFAFNYRLASGNERRGNFAVSAQIGTSVATGSYQNGQKGEALTPNFLVEKGRGPINIQSAFGATLPLGDTRLTGRQYVSNTALQSRVAGILSPELELNSTTYHGGPNTGKTQTSLTPGVILGRFPLTSLSGFAFGVGMQIAATRYHSYDHSLIFTVRLPMHRRHIDNRAGACTARLRYGSKCNDRLAHRNHYPHFLAFDCVETTVQRHQRPFRESEFPVSEESWNHFKTEQYSQPDVSGENNHAKPNS